MWLSKKISQSKKKNSSCSAEVTSSGSNITVQGSDEYRDISLLAPEGIAYVPTRGKECVLLPIGNKVVALGTAVSEKSLNEGEIMLYSGDGSITLKNDGSIHISGRVYINGTEY